MPSSKTKKVIVMDDKEAHAASLQTQEENKRAQRRFELMKKNYKSSRKKLENKYKDLEKTVPVTQGARDISRAFKSLRNIAKNNAAVLKKLKSESEEVKEVIKTFDTQENLLKKLEEKIEQMKTESVRQATELREFKNGAVRTLELFMTLIETNELASALSYGHQEFVYNSMSKTFSEPISPFVTQVRSKNKNVK